MKKLFSLIIILSVFFASCSTTKGPRPQRQQVTMAINVSGDNSLSFSNVSLDSYLFSVRSALNDFQNVNLVFVDPEDKPQVVLDISIENLDIEQTQQRTSNRVYSSRVQSGTDAAGKPVYQTITASVDITQTEIPARANLAYKLTFKTNPPKTLQQRYFENYTWRNVSIGNIQGDGRAIDPSIYAAQKAEIEPLAEDLLLTLSRRQMLRRISDDLRIYYPKPLK